MSKNKTKIVLSIVHPAHLVFFYRLITESELSESYEVKVVFQETSAFNGKKSIVKDILRKMNLKVVYIEKKDIVFYGRNIFKHIYKGLLLKNKIRRLCDKKSILLAHGDSSLGVHILINYFDNTIVFKVPKVNVNLEKYRYDYFINFRASIINFFLRNELVNFYKLKQSNFNIQHYISCKKINTISLEDKISNYPCLNFSNDVSSDYSDKVVIFGSAYHSWGLNVKTIAQIVKLHQEIFIKLKGRYNFFYIKHPIENGEEYNEIQEIFNGEINIVENFLSSEHYLIENPDVALCISIGSNSSISAYDMGFNSKVFYQLVDFSLNTKSIYNEIFRSYPSQIHLDSLMLNIEFRESHGQKNAYFDDLYKLIGEMGYE